MIAIVPIVVLVVGLLMWALGVASTSTMPARPLVADIGRILFCVGALVSTLVYSYVTVGDAPAPPRAPIVGPR